MKKSEHLCLLISFVVLFAPLVNAQGWEQVYGGPGLDVARSVRQCSDGGYIFTGEGTSTGQGILVGKTDESGDTVWVKTFGDPYYKDGDHPNSVFQCADGSYVITGEAWSFGGAWNIGDVFLMKLDAYGNQLWTKLYPNSGIDEGRAVIQTSDGGFILTSRGSYSFGTPSLDYFLLRTDADGDTLWTKSYFGLGALSGESVQETADGGFIMSGYIDAPLDTNGIYGDTSGLFVMRTDAGGVTEWTKIFSWLKTAWAKNPNYIFQTQDGGYVVTGDKAYPVVLSKSYLVKLDAGGDTLWSKIFDMQNGINYAECVLETSDGGIVVTGSSYDSSQTIRLYLLRTDQSGNIEWTNYYQDFSSGCEVHETTDGGFIISGGKYNFSNGWDLYLVKTDGDGNIATGLPAESSSKPFSKVYPNPFTSVVSVVMDGWNGENAELTVRDMMGQVRYYDRQDFSSSACFQNIDLSFLPGGIYFFETKYGGKQSAVKIIKE